MGAVNVGENISGINDEIMVGDKNRTTNLVTQSNLNLKGSLFLMTLILRRFGLKKESRLWMKLTKGKDKEWPVKIVRRWAIYLKVTWARWESWAVRIRPVIGLHQQIKRRVQETRAWALVQNWGDYYSKAQG